MPDWRSTQMMELVCAGIIVARNDLWARAALDDLSSTPYLTADLDLHKLKGFARFDWLERAVQPDVILKRFEQRTGAMVSTPPPRRMALARQKNALLGTGGGERPLPRSPDRPTYGGVGW
jgi:hypothetical protein